jgi:hypothetical protein
MTEQSLEADSNRRHLDLRSLDTRSCRRLRSKVQAMVFPAPEHLRTVTPRLVVRDGIAAIEFYRAAFGATELGERFTGPGASSSTRRCGSASQW